MPRRHRRAPEPDLSPLQRPTGLGIAPAWAIVEGATARIVAGDRPYRCPGCQQLIRPGAQHLVVVEDDDVDARRHWHTECWRRELRRRGYRV